MKSAAVAALSIAGAVAIAGVGYGAYQTMTPATSGYAEVVNVDPIVKTWQEPREVCQQVTVQRQKPVKDEHRITGSVVGAVVGGVIGHQFGGGRGKDVATVAGAAGGAMAGREIEKRARATTSYDITVSMETGGTRVVSVVDPAGLSVGSRVRVDGSNLIPR